MWALDLQFGVTTIGKTIKILHIVDEPTRESLSGLVAYSIDADATVAVLDDIVGMRGTPPKPGWILSVTCAGGEPTQTGEKPP